MFGRILCKLGIHKYARIRFRFGSWTECVRCGKRKQDK